MSVRRNRIKLYSVMILSILFALILGACGGSGSSTPPTTQKEVTGTVSVPNSSGKTLAAVNAYGTGAVTTNSFKLGVPNGALSLISISDSDTSKVVLMGMVEPDSAAVTIDTANCAASLIFLGLGGSGLKSDERSALWATIRSHSTTADLATAIDSAMATDLYALDNGNAAIKSALGNALSAQASLLPKQSEGAEPKGDTPANSFSIYDPKNNGTGKGEIEGNADGFQINNFRSRMEGACFVYKAGFIAKDGSHHLTPPAKFGSEHLFVPEDRSATIPLTLDSSLSGEYYQTVVLQPVFDQPAPPVFTDPDYSGEVATLRASLTNLYGRGLMKITAMQMFDAFGAPQVDTTAESLTASVTAFKAINGETTSIFFDAGNGTGLGGLVARCAAVPANSDADAFSTLAALAPLLQVQAPDLAQVFATKSLTSAQIQSFRSAMKILSLMGSWDFSTSSGFYVDAYSKGSAANVSKGIYGSTLFEVNPQSGSFDVGTTFQITTKVHLENNTNPITYEFDLDSAPGTITNAVMNDGQGKVGRTITTSSPNCYLVTGIDSTGIALLTVTMRTKDAEGADVSYSVTRKYIPNGHAEFTVLKATPGITGPEWYDICSGTRIPKPSPSNGKYGAFKLELWAEVTGDNTNWTHGNKYSVWNIPAYTGAPKPTSLSWEFIGNTPRFFSSGTSTMSFGAYDYGDHILLVNHRGGGKNGDEAYLTYITGVCFDFASAVQVRYRMTPQ